MNISERLDTMRLATPGCSMIAYGDLGTRLVLRNSAEVQPPQEFLDQLCIQAELGFSLQDALDPVCTNQARAANVIVVTPRETRIYIRSTQVQNETGNDAILCVCDDETSAQTLISPAQSLLNELAGDA